VRLRVGIGFFIVSIIWGLGQLPTVTEAVNTLEKGYWWVEHFSISLEPPARVGIGSALIGAGLVVFLFWRRYPSDRATKMAVVASGALVLATGVVMVSVSSVGRPRARPGPTPIATLAPGSVASTASHRHRAHHHRTAQMRPTVPAPALNGMGGARSPSASPPAERAAAPGSGGVGAPNPNRTASGHSISVNPTNYQQASSGAASGAGAKSGPASNSNQSAVTIITH
jgi:hypothetical protein